MHLETAANEIIIFILGSEKLVVHHQHVKINTLNSRSLEFANVKVMKLFRFINNVNV